MEQISQSKLSSTASKRMFSVFGEDNNFLDLSFLEGRLIHNRHALPLNLYFPFRYSRHNKSLPHAWGPMKDEKLLSGVNLQLFLYCSFCSSNKGRRTLVNRQRFLRELSQTFCATQQVHVHPHQRGGHISHQSVPIDGSARNNFEPWNNFFERKQPKRQPLGFCRKWMKDTSFAPTELSFSLMFSPSSGTASTFSWSHGTQYRETKPVYKQARIKKVLHPTQVSELRFWEAELPQTTWAAPARDPRRPHWIAYSTRTRPTRQGGASNPVLLLPLVVDSAQVET